jgi:hypothetical protein
MNALYNKNTEGGSVYISKFYESFFYFSYFFQYQKVTNFFVRIKIE